MTRLTWRRIIMTALASTSVLANSACFGSFPLTRKVYGFNKGVSEEKWVRELVFLALVAVPVYSIAGLIDVVILNSQEFWTGKETKLSSGPETKVKTITKGNVTVTQTMTTAATGRTMVLEEKVNGVFKSRTTMHQAVGTSVVTAETVFADGRTEQKTMTADEAGKITISSNSGMTRTLSDAEVSAMTARLAQVNSGALAATR